MVIVKRKTYVVFRGRVPGIYNNWPACHQQVNGFNGNLHRSYDDVDEACMVWQDFMARNNGNHIFSNDNNMIHNDGCGGDQIQRNYPTLVAPNHPPAAVMPNLIGYHPMNLQQQNRNGVSNSSAGARPMHGRFRGAPMVIVAVVIVMVYLALLRT